MKEKNTINSVAGIVVILIIALGVGGYLYWQDQAERSESTSQPPPSSTSATPQKPGATGIGKSTLIGGWVALETSAALEGLKKPDEFERDFLTDAIKGEYSYREYLHQRLSESGSWKLNGNRLTITLPEENFTQTYLIQELTATRLVLQLPKDGSEEIYQRINTKP